jgi:hypothetical protein
VFGVLFLGAVVAGVVLIAVAFPPRSARRWRHLTRPLRRRLRPGHYRGW